MCPVYFVNYVPGPYRGHIKEVQRDRRNHHLDQFAPPDRTRGGAVLCVNQPSTISLAIFSKILNPRVPCVIDVK
jgi:hypothetical protein